MFADTKQFLGKLYVEIAIQILSTVAAALFLGHVTASIVFLGFTLLIFSVQFWRKDTKMQQNNIDLLSKSLETSADLFPARNQDRGVLCLHVKSILTTIRELLINNLPGHRDDWWLLLHLAHYVPRRPTNIVPNSRFDYSMRASFMFRPLVGAEIGPTIPASFQNKIPFIDDSLSYDAIITGVVKPDNDVKAPASHAHKQFILAWEAQSGVEWGSALAAPLGCSRGNFGVLVIGCTKRNIFVESSIKEFLLGTAGTAAGAVSAVIAGVLEYNRLLYDTATNCRPNGYGAPIAEFENCVV